MLTNNPDCPFCKIVRQNDPEVYEVFRNDHVVAFFPINPVVPGHLLVVPQRHIINIWHLDPEEATQLSHAILRLSSAIQCSLSPEGLNIIQSNGEVATQSVPHLHVHLIPRWNNDNMGSIWPGGTSNYSDSEKKETLYKIRNAITQTNNPTFCIGPEDKRKHLDYIQAIVTRQSAASSSAKGWLLPIVTATFGFALTQRSWHLAVVGLVPILLFAYLDANYLRSEKRFRALYNTVAQSKRSIPHFTLDPIDAETPPENNKLGCWQAFTHAYFPEWDIWKSWSILPFYLALFILGIGVISVILFTTHETPSQPSPSPTKTLYVTEINLEAYSASPHMVGFQE
jgi:histidine triad protein